MIIITCLCGSHMAALTHIEVTVNDYCYIFFFLSFEQRKKGKETVPSMVLSSDEGGHWMCIWSKTMISQWAHLGLAEWRTVSGASH